MLIVLPDLKNWVVYWSVVAVAVVVVSVAVVFAVDGLPGNRWCCSGRVEIQDWG